MQRFVQLASGSGSGAVRDSGGPVGGSSSILIRSLRNDAKAGRNRVVLATDFATAA